jgi:hypothetical protein
MKIYNPVINNNEVNTIDNAAARRLSVRGDVNLITIQELPNQIIK